MALSTNTMRGAIRYLPGANKLAAINRLIIYPSTTAPTYGNYIRPTAAPTGTTAEGDWYFDSTIHAPKFAASSAGFAPVGGLGPVKTAAATLSIGDAGATCFFNSAAGDIYTLPAPVIGLEFTFVILVTITSNAAKVITDAGTTFLLGGLIQSTDGTYTSAYQSANGTTIRAISMNGSTTGGFQGDWWKVKCISATQWAIWGMGRANGTEATPFATS